MLDFIWLCERGLKREINQDRAGGFVKGDAGLFYVADGLGGHYAGEQASGLLAREAGNWWRACRDGLPPVEEAADALQKLLRDCGRMIREATPPGEICGTTAVLLLVRGDVYLLLSVGDSRCYWTGRGSMRPGTALLTADDAAPPGGPEGGRLLRAVGDGSGSPAFMRGGRIRGTGVFSLCTDGIYKTCPARVLSGQLRRAARGRLQASAGRIEREVCARGAPDNYALVLIRVKPDGRGRAGKNGGEEAI